jgi:ribosome-binding ATPase YchF (GTP1/OBG family)
VGVVADKDERLKKIAEVMNSKQILPAVFEFVDIAGLVKGAHQGVGLGNQFLARIRECDAIIHLVRVFQNTEIVHFEGKTDPLADFEAVENELKMKDEQSILRQRSGSMVSEIEPSKEKVNLLSKKPQLVILNGQENEVSKELIEKLKKLNRPYLIWNLKNDTDEENLQKIFDAFKNLLDLITFFTANENEARSWFIKRGTRVPQAAGVIHTDFEKKFIKAEVINWQKLLEAGSWQNAKQKGLIRLEGKDYLVQDGDVILIKHA